MMKTSAIFGRALAIGLALLLAACATSQGGSIPYNVDNFGTPDAPTRAAFNDTYKLAPLDTVTVAVFQVADLSRDYTIDESGSLTMPLLGQVNAAGLSARELASAIARGLDAKYLRNPNVTVALKDSASQIITVDGSVRQPGVYPAGGARSLVQAIAVARGTDDVANSHRVAIFRTIGGKRMAAAFDLIQIRRGDAQDPPVYPGDMVIVDGSGLKKARRELLQSLPLAAIFRPF